MLARSLLRGERQGHTLSTTALVHEAYLRLLNERSIGVEDRRQFFAVAATAMRRILVDAARRRRRKKRGGGQDAVPLDEVESFLSDAEAEEVVLVDEALEHLGRSSPRAKEIVELRFFAGLSMAETAQMLDVSEKTVQRDWTFARAWLRSQVGRSPGEQADVPT